MNPTPRKILVVGDGNVPTGFGRVVHSLLERLPRHYEIHHLGINYSGEPHDAPWPIYPAHRNGDPYGVERVPELVDKLRPDLVFVVCDPWILTRFAAALAPYQRSVRTVCYTPVEGTPLEPSIAQGLRHIDRIVAYNRFGAEALDEAFRAAAAMDATLGSREIAILPHGVDQHLFRPLSGDPLADRAAAKRLLLPDREDFQDSFIVLNANRNQPRKRIDLTMKGFARFAQGKPANVKLYLHMGLEDCGWNLAALARRLNIEDRLILTSTEPQLAWEPVGKLNLIYNACDVGINTSIGEGWGLVSFEHAATGAAQIVPRHSACAELWEGAAEMMEPSFSLTTERILLEGWFVTEETVAASLERLYHDPHLRAERALQGYLRATDPALGWGSIADRWVALFEDLLTNHPFSQTSDSLLQATSGRVGSG